MKKIEKVQILDAINSIDKDSLVSFIKDGSISFDEMIKAGLHQSMQEEISNSLKAVEVIKDNLQNRQEICAAIERGDYSVVEIKSMLLKNEISETDLLSYTSFSKDLIAKIKNYIKVQTPFNDWENLPPLKPKRTDVYFFGQPGSGKSCVLASLFKYFSDNGLMQVDIDNLAGAQYLNLLKDEFEFGILPDSTAEDGVNYIALNLRSIDNRNNWHPLNFIEMSGEHFNSAYKHGINSSNLGRKNFLTNDNQKIIFFVIDYDMHMKRKLSQGGISSQSGMMVNILELLDKTGTLKKTQAIYILLTKTDLFPAGVNRKTYADDFLKEYYLNFRENCIDKKRKYNDLFKVLVFPYSIGEVKFQSILLSIDYQSPAYVTEAIRNHSFIVKEKTGIWG